LRPVLPSLGVWKVIIASVVERRPQTGNIVGLFSIQFLDGTLNSVGRIYASIYTIDCRH